MEYAVAQHLLYFPPLLIAGLIALYRNNILCFWDCNPMGVAVKQFHGQVAVRLSALLQLARTTGLMIRNFPSAVAAKISFATDLIVQTLRSKALLLVNSIRGILITIRESVFLVIYQVKSFLRYIFTVISNYTSYIQNTTIDFFRSVPKPSNSLYIGFIVAVTFVCIALVLYWQESKQVPGKESIQDPLQEPVKMEVEEKKPVRRRTKKSA